jgi:hypothetical protein
VSHDRRDAEYLGDEEPVKVSSTEPDYVTAIKTALPILANVYQQDQLNRLNVSRMSAGLPPLTGAEYARNYSMPAAQVQVDTSAQVRNLVLFGGAVVIAAALVMRKGRR